MNVQNNTASDHMWRFLHPPGKSGSDDIIAVSTHPLHCLAMWSLCGIHIDTGIIAALISIIDELTVKCGGLFHCGDTNTLSPYSLHYP